MQSRTELVGIRLRPPDREHRVYAGSGLIDLSDDRRDTRGSKVVVRLGELQWVKWLVRVIDAISADIEHL